MLWGGRTAQGRLLPAGGAREQRPGEMEVQGTLGGSQQPWVVGVQASKARERVWVRSLGPCALLTLHLCPPGHAEARDHDPARHGAVLCGVNILFCMFLSN